MRGNRRHARHRHTRHVSSPLNAFPCWSAGLYTTDCELRGDPAPPQPWLLTRHVGGPAPPNGSCPRDCDCLPASPLLPTFPWGVVGPPHPPLPPPKHHDCRPGRCLCPRVPRLCARRPPAHGWSAAAAWPPPRTIVDVCVDATVGGLRGAAVRDTVGPRVWGGPTAMCGDSCVLYPSRPASLPPLRV